MLTDADLKKIRALVATKQDVLGVQKNVEKHIASATRDSARANKELSREITRMREALQAEIAKTREDLSLKIDGLRLDIKNDIAEVREDIGTLREQSLLIMQALDGIAKSIEDLRMEYIAMKMQLDRHERWIKEIAEKTGVKLSEW